MLHITNGDTNFAYHTTIKGFRESQALLKEITVLEKYFDIAEDRIIEVSDLQKDSSFDVQKACVESIRDELKRTKEKYNIFKKALNTLTASAKAHRDTNPSEFRHFNNFENAFNEFYRQAHNMRNQLFAKRLSQSEQGAVFASRIHYVLRKLVIFYPSNPIEGVAYIDPITLDVIKHSDSIVVHRFLYSSESIRKSLYEKEKSSEGPLLICKDPYGAPICLEDYLYLLAKLKEKGQFLPKKLEGLKNISEDYFVLCQLILEHGGSLEKHIFFLLELLNQKSLNSDEHKELFKTIEEFFTHHGDDNTFTHLKAIVSLLLDLDLDANVAASYFGYLNTPLLDSKAYGNSSASSALSDSFSENESIALGSSGSGVSVVAAENLVADGSAFENTHPCSQLLPPTWNFSALSESTQTSATAASLQDAQQVRRDKIREAAESRNSAQKAQPILSMMTEAYDNTQFASDELDSKINVMLGSHVSLLAPYHASVEGIVAKLFLYSESERLNTTRNFLKNLQKLHTAGLGSLYEKYGFEAITSADSKLIDDLKKCSAAFQSFQDFTQPSSSTQKTLFDVVNTVAGKGKEKENVNLEEELASFQAAIDHLEISKLSRASPLSSFKGFSKNIDAIEEEPFEGECNSFEGSHVSQEKELSIISSEIKDEQPTQQDSQLKLEAGASDRSNKKGSFVELDVEGVVQDFLKAEGFENAQSIKNYIKGIHRQGDCAKQLEYFLKNITTLLGDECLKDLYPRFGLEKMIEKPKVFRELITLKENILILKKEGNQYQKQLLSEQLKGDRTLFSRLIKVFDCPTFSSLLAAITAMDLLLKDKKCHSILKHASSEKRNKCFKEEMSNKYKKTRPCAIESRLTYQARQKTLTALYVDEVQRDYARAIKNEAKSLKGKNHPSSSRRSFGKEASKISFDKRHSESEAPSTRHISSKKPTTNDGHRSHPRDSHRVDGKTSTQEGSHHLDKKGSSRFLGLFSRAHATPEKSAGPFDINKKGIKPQHTVESGRHKVDLKKA